MKVRWIKNKLYGESPKMGKVIEFSLCGSNEKFDFITSKEGAENSKKLGIPREYLIWIDDSGHPSNDWANIPNEEIARVG